MAALAGALAFLIGMLGLVGLTNLSDDPEDRLFEINIFVGSAVVFMGLGGFLVVQAASALGGVGSSAFRVRMPWLLLPIFPVAVAVGQWQANDPTRVPWLFPFVNIAVVAVPSLLFAAVVIGRYHRRNPLAWPLTWREVTSSFTWGAIGATTLGGILNTAYLILGGAWFLDRWGSGDIWDIGSFAWTLDGWPGIIFDLSVLSVVAPLNEEFWKGSLVALFFFRRGGMARCFVWGVLAGTGFNLLETFFNSLAAVNPEELADQTIGGQWWLFAVARAGTAVMHGFASGLAALGFYGVFRRRWSLVPLFMVGALFHGAWNAAVYLVAGDVFLSGEGPDARWLDIAAIGALVILGLVCAAAGWLVSGRLRDRRPASIYGMLGMRPGREEARPLPPFVMQELAGR